MKRVAGYCPMGCGKTLFLSRGGCVACSSVQCPAPDAVNVILGDSETEHIIRFDAVGFSIQHPLRERLNGELFDCMVHRRLRGLTEMPVEEPGLYRMIERPGERPTFVEMDTPAR